MAPRFHNPSDNDSKPEGAAPNSPDLRTAVIRRLQRWESATANRADPWAALSTLMTTDLFRTNIDRQAAVRHVLTGTGTASERLLAAEGDIKLLLRGARRVTRLLTIELERGVNSKSAK